MRGKPVQVGQRFGLVTVLSQAGRSADGHVLWMCRCDCGGEKVWQSNVLKRSKVPSCGCHSSEQSRLVSTKHGQRNSGAYASWKAAKERCHTPTNKDYPRYGALGITMCAEWRESFEAFLSYMGHRPLGMTLDRFPNQSGNYEPGNCRWATGVEQIRNRRNSVYVEWRGERTHLSLVATELGITYSAAFMRLKRGKLYENHSL